MKKFLKILLIIAVPLLLVAGFCGYHFYRMLSLDPGVYLSGDGSGAPESALDMLLFSKDLPKGIVCGELPSHLRTDDFDPEKYLEIGSAVEFLSRKHDESGKRAGYELSERYEKDSLDGELRSKWGEGTIITKSSKEDSCFRVSKKIKAESADSVVLLEISTSGDSSLYVGKRKNGIVTECVACKWRDGRCDEVFSERKMDLDPVSGKLLSYASKTRMFYVEGSSYEGNEFYANKMMFDSLQRLVAYEYDNRVFRYEYSSNDTANYKVNILGKSGQKVGFYKRKLKGNREIVKYGTDRGETEITRYFENGKIIKETSKEFDFYESVTSRTKLFNSAGDEVVDSAFYEDTFFPEMRFEPNSFIVKYEYDETGKLKYYEQFQESFVRMLPFVFLPVKKESREKVGKLKFDYDDAGRLKSITDESVDENQGLWNRFPYYLFERKPGKYQ